MLKGKAILLTGALGTLGRAQAQAFAEAGARLLLLDRPGHPEGDSFANDLGARFVACDLNDLTATEATATSLVENEGGIDVLVNNAALIVNRPFEQFSASEYEEQLRVNSSSAFVLVRALAPAMKAKGYGKVINFCSITLNGRWEGYVPYVASKGALLGLTKSLARELGPHGIRVNAISPGAVVSDAEQRVFGDRLEAFENWVLENQSIKRRIQPSDIASVVLFLASPASDMISGQNVEVNGGW